MTLLGKVPIAKSEDQSSIPSPHGRSRKLILANSFENVGWLCVQVQCMHEHTHMHKHTQIMCVCACLNCFEEREDSASSMVMTEK